MLMSIDKISPANVHQNQLNQNKSGESNGDIHDILPDILGTILSHANEAGLYSAAAVSKSWAQKTIVELSNRKTQKINNFIRLLTDKINKEKYSEVIIKLNSLINENLISKSTDLIEMKENILQIKEKIAKVLSDMDDDGIAERIRTITIEIYMLKKTEASKTIEKNNESEIIEMNNEQETLKRENVLLLEIFRDFFTLAELYKKIFQNGIRSKLFEEEQIKELLRLGDIEKVNTMLASLKPVFKAQTYLDISQRFNKRGNCVAAEKFKEQSVAVVKEHVMNITNVENEALRNVELWLCCNILLAFNCLDEAYDIAKKVSNTSYLHRSCFTALVYHCCRIENEQRAMEIAMGGDPSVRRQMLDPLLKMYEKKGNGEKVKEVKQLIRGST